MSESLPLARAQAVTPPDGVIMERLIGVCGSSPSALSYAYEILSKVLNNVKKQFPLGVVENTLEAFGNHVNNINLAVVDRSSSWDGISPENTSLLKRFQAFQLEQTIDTLKGIENFNLDFAIDDEKGHFIRAITVNGADADKKTTEGFDQLLSASLVQNQMIVKDGIVWQLDQNDEILTDNQGNPIHADPESIRRVLLDPRNQFQKYCAGKGLKFTVVEHPFPTPVATNTANESSSPS